MGSAWGVHVWAGRAAHAFHPVDIVATLLQQRSDPRLGRRQVEQPATHATQVARRALVDAMGAHRGVVGGRHVRSILEEARVACQRPLQVKAVDPEHL